MKKVLGFFLLACIITLPATAQQTKESDLAVAVESLRKALVDGDTAVLGRLSSSELSYAHSNGLVQDKPSFLLPFTNGTSDFVSIDLSDQTIMVKKDIGIVRHILQAETNDNGKAGKTKLAVLLVWHKGKNGWKLLARHATKLVM